MDIAKESGMLYDKFVLFTEDLIKIGERIKATKADYDAAMNKLTTSTKKAIPLSDVWKTLKISANTSKSLDQRLIDKTVKNDDYYLIPQPIRGINDKKDFERSFFSCYTIVVYRRAPSTR